MKARYECVVKRHMLNDFSPLVQWCNETWPGSHGQIWTYGYVGAERPSDSVNGVFVMKFWFQNQDDAARFTLTWN